MANLESLRRKSRKCTACHLYKNATQTVFGEGTPSAALMLVGEQPGSEEDLKGKPFVGPAGGILKKAMAAAGITADEVYVTNAVKHFKWSPSDRPHKPRLHKTPNAGEVKACNPWLQGEVAAVKPQIILALGRTAVYACLGKNVTIADHRQKIQEHEKFGWKVLPTWHPSAILRAPDEKKREKLFNELVEDLKFAKSNRRPAATQVRRQKPQSEFPAEQQDQ